MRTSLLKGYFFCLFAVGFWGMTFVTTKKLLVDLPPTQILFVRFVIGYITLWIIAPRALKFQGLNAEFRLFLLGLLGITLYFFFENLALQKSSASSVAVLVCTAPLFTALFSRIGKQRTKLTRSYWIGFILAMTGVILITTQGDLRQLKLCNGALLALLGAITWAIYCLIPQTIPSPSSALLITRRMFFWGLILMLPLCLHDFSTWQLAPVLKWGNLWRLLFLGVIASALCYSAWNIATERIGGIRASLLLYLNPVIGVAAGVLILKESLTSFAFIGVAFTLAGVWISSKFTGEKHEHTC
ncbi:MAG: DMT family transporter [Kiritimatiellia bacterium]